ncbi:DGQHR domain-containing protein DpdB [Polyangium sp. 6x1]|uniref:DGQHR domain-containing protein DpdB n=1 Tax=Polyangium sp. 6x1 TaxID=3042689 RepID=UPI0024827A64|nr:DGQHR domain-containing protein DpdB [Polyangium sp. 6x1]MDI1450826.1 DGQHR domain-containing protein DpdB [Polyangium sp. 6x1]
MVIIRRNAIRRRALRIFQDKDRPVYMFTLRADELLKVADISRVARDNTGDLIGYQRPEVRKHVQNILDYLDQDGGQVLLPNAIILSLSSTAVFQQVRGPKVDDGLCEAGTLLIPLPKAGYPKPAWIVDGQQRAMALSRCKRQDYPIPVCAFIADDVDTQREQFLRINSTKPLPRGLITELLPKVDTLLPANLAARRAPAAMCELLSSDPESPFHGLIRRSSAKRAPKTSVVADTVVIQVLQESFGNPSGCLFSYRNIATGETDFESIRKLLFMYWQAVKDAFPHAWGVPATQSRLMHGAGLRAMGKLMDRVMASVNVDAHNTPQVVRRELARIAPICRWTSGTWEDLGGLKWNELQTVPNHIRMLSNYLVRAYLDGRREVR